MQNVSKGTVINLKGVESERTYHFQDRSETFHNPTELEIRKDNTHIITCDSGTHTVESDWLAFSFKGHYEFNVGDKESNHFTDLNSQTLHVKYESSDEVFNFIVPNSISLLQKQSGSLMVVSEGNLNYYFNKGFKLTNFLSDS